MTGVAALTSAGCARSDCVVVADAFARGRTPNGMPPSGSAIAQCKGALERAASPGRHDRVGGEMGGRSTAVGARSDTAHSQARTQLTSIVTLVGVASVTALSLKPKTCDSATKKGLSNGCGATSGASGIHPVRQQDLRS